MKFFINFVFYATCRIMFSSLIYLYLFIHLFTLNNLWIIGHLWTKNLSNLLSNFQPPPDNAAVNSALGSKKDITRDIKSVIESTLTISKFTLAHIASYTCKVTGSNALQKSQIFTLSYTSTCKLFEFEYLTTMLQSRY